MANTLWILAHFFTLKYDDTLKEYGEDDDVDADWAFLEMDDMRDDLVQKFWIYHNIITVGLFPGDTAEDEHGRRAGGNNINIILERYFESRARLSKHTQDDPVYEPPSKTDFITPTKVSIKKCSQAKHGIMPGEALAANGGIVASQFPPALAEHKPGKPEGDANEESDAEINRQRESRKIAADWLANQQSQQCEHPVPKSNTKTDASDVAGGHASPAAAAPPLRSRSSTQCQHWCVIDLTFLSSSTHKSLTWLDAMSWEYVRNSPLNNTMQRKEANTIH